MCIRDSNLIIETSFAAFVLVLGYFGAAGGRVKSGCSLLCFQDSHTAFVEAHPKETEQPWQERLRYPP
eukprot:5130141-Amphidinium_carterae.1